MKNTSTKAQWVDESGSHTTFREAMGAELLIRQHWSMSLCWEMVLRDQIKRQPRITLKRISLPFIYNEQMDWWPFNSTIIASHSVSNRGFDKQGHLPGALWIHFSCDTMKRRKTGGQLCLNFTSLHQGRTSSASSVRCVHKDWICCFFGGQVENRRWYTVQSSIALFNAWIISFTFTFFCHGIFSIYWSGWFISIAEMHLMRNFLYQNRNMFGFSSCGSSRDKHHKISQHTCPLFCYSGFTGALCKKNNNLTKHCEYWQWPKELINFFLMTLF